MPRVDEVDFSDVRAILTSAWGSKKYRPRTVHTIEDYYIDTALDTDADTWAVTIGDPNFSLIEALDRDNEVRTQLFASSLGRSKLEFLVTGIADEIAYSEDGSLRMQGRDMSCLATDSTVPPKQYRHIKAHALVAQQARAIGIRGPLNLSPAAQVRKLQYVDGSESYWQFWYRLYRKEKCWLYMTPQGGLNATRLRYSANPSYYFGKPPLNAPPRIRERVIPVIHADVKKSTQGRVHEVWVYGHKGDNGFLEIARDPTMAHWLKKPRKIIYDNDAHNRKQAQRTAWEEIFEGKVGSLEYSLTIADPGFSIRQDSIARVRIPEMGLDGEFFVVGVRRQGGPDGLLQEVRLREKQYAISRRTPEDPKLVTQRPADPDTVKEFATTLGVDMGVPYADAFIKAAKEFHGPWNYPLFLATLIAIGHQETGGRFRNIRANGGPGEDDIEWYRWEAAPEVSLGPGEIPTVTNPGRQRDRYGRTRQQWEQIFANEPSSGYTGGKTYAVGPMQLYTLDYKHWADDYHKPGHRDQYTGGRWHVPSNIRAAARVLRGKLQAAVRDSGRDIDMWAGVSLYGHNAQDYSPGNPTKYALSVKNLVYNNPGYLKDVQQALEAAREAARAAKDGDTDPYISEPSEAPRSLPSKERAVQIIKNLGIQSQFGLGENEIREGIVAAAMFGYYNREVISYTQGSQRMKDFGPPPNVPAATDCSAFATWCHKSARAPDPNGLNYNGQGYTGTLVQHGQIVGSVNALRPGDLIFYGGTSSVPGHVAVYVGANLAVSHGSESGPNLVQVNYRSDRHSMRSYL